MRQMCCICALLIYEVITFGKVNSTNWIIFQRSFNNFHFLCNNRNSALANGLAARGHNVTIISADRNENPLNGIHYIEISDSALTCEGDRKNHEFFLSSLLKASYYEPANILQQSWRRMAFTNCHLTQKISDLI